MTRLRQRRPSGTTTGGSTSATSSPGKRALTDGVRVRQAKAEGPAGPGGGEVAAAGGGAALPGGVRDKMERSFGTSFGDVRVHEGPQAAALGAQAYAEGSDVHFAGGKYDPDSAGGQELLGHELAHVVQQRDGRVDEPQGKDDGGGDGINADASLEAEADTAGARAAQGLPATGDGAAAPLDTHGTPDAGPPESVFAAKGTVNADDTELVNSVLRSREVLTTLGKDKPVEVTHVAGDYYKVVTSTRLGYVLRSRVTLDAAPEETEEPKETAEPAVADPYQGIIDKAMATLPIEDGGTFYHLPADFGLKMVMKGCNLSKPLLPGMGGNSGWLRTRVGPCFKEVGAVSGGPQFYAMVTNANGDHFIARTAVHAHTVLPDGSKRPGHFPDSLEGFWIHADWEKRMGDKK